MNKQQKKIIFISSWPKSGNTWIRAVLAALIYGEKGKFNFDYLKKIKLFSVIQNFNKLENFKIDKDGFVDLNFTIENWINAQKIINNNINETKFYKTHNVRGQVNGKNFTDENVCGGYIYVVRDPRDIVVSYAHYYGINIDESIEILLNNKKSTGTIYKVYELPYSWKNHFYSWNDFNAVPRLFIKYEYMLDNLQEVIETMIKFINTTTTFGINNEKDVIDMVIASTKFQNLKSIETKEGFNEASPHSKFFRKGEKNQWKKALNISQVNKIEKELYKPMRQLGYL